MKPVLQESNSLPIIAISGPTASGKSNLAVQLALSLNAEIINADSVQLYKGFIIGSGSIEAEEQKGVPHHFLNSFSPEKELDVYEFSKIVKIKISELHQRDKIPIIVGGSGLYLESLFNNLSDIPEISEKSKLLLNEKIEELKLNYGDDYVLHLHKWLEEIDSESSQNIKNRDISRIQRSLLVYLETGETLPQLQKRLQKKPNLSNDFKNSNVLIYILKPERENLYKKINSRVDLMFSQGLVEEVEKLKQLFPRCRALKAIGYSHVLSLLNNELAIEECKELLKRDTRHFAKRQETWWRNRPSKLNWPNFEYLKFLELFSETSSSKGLDETQSYATWKESAFQIGYYFSRSKVKSSAVKTSAARISEAEISEHCIDESTTLSDTKSERDVTTLIESLKREPVLLGSTISQVNSSTLSNINLQEVFANEFPSVITVPFVL